MARTPGGSTSTRSQAASAATRPTREKKSRKIFDPADHEQPVTKRPRRRANQSPDHSVDESSTPTKTGSNKDGGSRTGNNVCRMCGLGAAASKQGLLLKCSECNKPVHSKCIGYSDSLAQYVNSSSSKWQCTNCKVCCECHSKRKMNDSMLFCDACDLGYHMSCHQPSVKNRPDGSWKCYKCAKHNYTSNNSSTTHNNSNNSLKTKKPALKETSSKVSNQPLIDTTEELVTQFRDFLPDDEVENYFHSKKDNSLKSVPDVSNWTSRQLSNYFRQFGFMPSLYNVFLEQEIDGAALILLERHDFVENLGLRLGPALKIYQEIQKLKDRYNQLHQI